MNESASPRRMLHLVVDGFSADRLEEIQASRAAGDVVEIFPLTEANSREALTKIFAADTVAVWGKL